MSNSKYDDDSFEDDLIEEFGLKDDDETISDLDNELRQKEENLGMQAPEEEYIFDEEEEKEKKKKKKKKKKKGLNTKRVLIIGFIIILICIIIDASLIGYKLIYKEVIDVKPILIYSNKPVVYDNTSINRRIHDHVPVVNINNSSMNDINNQVNKIYNNYLKNNPVYFRYDYSINNDVISIVLIYKNQTDLEDYYSYKFKTFNISLKSLSLYNNDLLLDKYDLKLSDVHKRMREDFQKKYEELIEKNYIDETYSYNKLITDLELSNFTKEVNYYVEDNKLYVYRSFNINNNKKISSYFKESSYKFYIK